MKKIILLSIFYLSFQICNAQKIASYISDINLYGNKADLFCANTESYILNKTLSFKDTISVLSFDKKSEIQKKINFILNPKFPFDSFSKKTYPNELGGLQSWNDSIKVDDKWYKIFFQYNNNGFVGGMKATIDKKIFVNGIGVVYSYSSKFSHSYFPHNLFMLNHKDKYKQKVLTKVYTYLDKKRDVRFKENWKKMSILTLKYNFDNCITLLSENWPGNIYSGLLDWLINENKK